MTQAGALTASDATITGAITANSGSLAGFLTIGSSGGIYQGTGSFASPTTGLKMWNDSGVGRIGGFNNSTLQWYASTDGYLYGGDGTNSRFRLGNDSFRSLTNNGGSNQYGIWFLDGITSTSPLTDNMYAFLYHYKLTTSGSEQSDLTIINHVNSGIYTTYNSIVTMSARSYTGTVNREAKLRLISTKNSGARYMRFDGDYFYIDGYMWFAPITAPGTPASGVVLYCDTADGKLKSKNSSGSTQNLSA